MKLSFLIAYHYLVYVGIAILITSAKAVTPCIPAHQSALEDAKQATAYEPTSNKILHNELLYRY